MTRHIQLALTAVILSSCAMSMEPSEFMAKFPSATEAHFFSMTDAERVLGSGECRVLVAGRNYSAPLGLTVDDDLKNGAKGVDDWVRIDGGNAYRLINFKWVDVLEGTQLVVYFDTMICDQEKPQRIGV